MTGRRAAAIICDVTLIVIAAGLVYLFATGGGTLPLGPVRIRIMTARNPTVIGSLVVLLRCVWLAQVPFPGARFTPASVSSHLLALFSRVDPPRAAVAPLAVAVAISVAIRAANAVMHPGFSTGDDIEVHVMSLGAVLHTGWPSWELRNPLYPMAFLYPIQAVVHAAGVSDPGLLIVAGRLVVVAMATVTILLVHRITMRITGNATTAVLAAVVVAASRLHLWFGGSEFPRPVATAFIAGAFLLLLAPSTARAAAAGVLLAAGGALRFGELMFFAPGLLQLAVEKRWREAVVMAGFGLAAGAALLGVSDWMFWGEPFASVRQLFTYTILEGRSSRGFQPPLYYVTHLTEWSTVAVAGLALWGLRLDRRVALWAVVPMALLSLLPHKEPRYLLPIYPFIAIAAALAVRDLVLHLRRIPAVTIVALVTIAVLGETSMWRFVKTDSAVRLAREVAAWHPAGIAAQQVWRFGGPLYWPGIPLAELPDDAPDASAIDDGIDTVILVRQVTQPALVADLERRHFQAFPAVPGDGEYVVFRR